MKKLYFFSVCTFLSIASFAQTTFQKVYPSIYDQEGLDVLPTDDGGYIIAGYTTNTLVDDADLLIVKTNALGDTVWTKSYGGPEPEFANSILKTADNNYFIIGYSQSFGGGDYDTWLVKINPSGDTLWSRTYGGWGNEEGREVIPTSDGNYVITGLTDSPTPSNMNAFLIKIDPNGNEIWSKNYGGAGYDCGNSVKQTLDGGYIIIGETFSYGAGNCDAWMIRTNATGDTTWTKTFGGPHRDEGKFITANADGSFTFVVRDSSYGSGDIDVTIIKTNSAGGVLWSKTYGGTLKDTDKMIQPTTDGGYIVAAISRSFGWIEPDMWILKLDAAGDTLWTRNYGGTDHEHCYSVRQTSDGGYIAIGKTRSYGPKNQVMFLKLNSMGSIGPVAIPEEEQLAWSPAYPNPASGKVNFVYEGNEAAELVITSSLGQVVHRQQLNGPGTISANLEGQAPGIYFMMLNGASGSRIQKVMIR